MSSGAWILVGALTLAVLFGGYRALTDGRFRGTHRIRGAAAPVPTSSQVSVLAGTAWENQLGERFTLLQFSSAFCAPCRATRRILEDVASSEPGVQHLDIDAEHHLDLVRRLGILRTPTTLILDASGQERGRASGTPTRTQVVSTLNRD